MRARESERSVRDTIDQVVLIWNEVGFPLWHEPRPQFELFAEVKDIIQYFMNWRINSNYEELAASGDRKAWIRWTFANPIDEATRMKIQAKLQEHYGDETGKGFRWEGARTRIEMGTVVALGPHIQ